MSDYQTIPEQSDFHSPEVDEIMGRPPSWILRWGIAVIFAVFVGIVVMSCFISSPQVVVGEIMLSSDNPSVQLSAGASGSLIVLRSPSDSLIHAGMPIACIGKRADYERVVCVETCLRQSYGIPAGSGARWPRIDSLPDEFRNQYTEFRLAYGTVLFDRSREELEAGIRAWKDKYLLVAPIAGKVTVTAGRYVREGEPVARIIPGGESRIIGRMQVVAGYDRIRPGMKVWVRISLPETDEGGKHQAIVSRVVPMGDTENELVYVEMQDGIPERWYSILQTRSLYGTAEIILKQGNLFQKFISFKSN